MNFVSKQPMLVPDDCPVAAPAGRSPSGTGPSPWAVGKSMGNQRISVDLGVFMKIWDRVKTYYYQF